MSGVEVMPELNHIIAFFISLCGRRLCDQETAYACHKFVPVPHAQAIYFAVEHRLVGVFQTA